jgi:hypothetical protein
MPLVLPPSVASSTATPTRCSTVRYFIDSNANKVLDGQEWLMHTTAENEAEYAQGKAVNLTHSHGCIHMHPKDRDALIANGAIRAGGTLINHPYSERSV